MKGQMSLEMVIGLLILLVVAAVVINLFLGNIQSIKKTEDFQKDIDFRKFKSTCEGLCKGGDSGSLIAYCSQKLQKTDLDGDPTVRTLIEYTPPACEDALYCFIVAPCELETGKIGPKECRQILCKAWTDIYNDDISKATCKINELIPTFGTCNIKTSDNWYYLGGFKDQQTGVKDACGNPCK